MIYKIKKYISHIIVWIIVGLICTIFADRYTSYLNIGMGLGVGVTCMGIMVKTVTEYDISRSAKKVVDIVVIYSICTCTIFLSGIYYTNNFDITDNLAKVVSIVYLCELMSVYAYIIRVNVQKQIKLNILFISIILTGIYSNMYVNIASVRSTILITLYMVIICNLCIKIYKEYSMEFINYSTYFAGFILTRMFESIYIMVFGINQTMFIYLLLLRFIQIYYLLKCTVYSGVKQELVENNNLEVLEEEENRHNKISCVIANLSHELKTPINVIMSALEIINIEKKTDNNLKKEVVFIRKECAVIMDMVQMIVDIQRIHDEKDSNSIKKYNVVELIENITDAFNYEYGKGKIIFDTREEEICVRVNKSLVQQAIMGILHTIICINSESSIDIYIEKKGQNKFKVLIYNSSIVEIIEIVEHINNKVHMDYTESNMIYILSVQLLMETLEAYGGSIVFKKCGSGQVMEIIMLTDKDELKETSVISEWNIDELREGIKIKYLA